MTVRGRFESIDYGEELVEMAMAEGMTAAMGQIGARL